MTDKQLTEAIRVVPDFPVKGIQFFDVTTLFKSPEAYNEVLDRICSMYKDKGITKVAGIESRGFIAGAAVAARLGAGFVPIRKPGKLPATALRESYQKEYGTDSIEIHADERPGLIRQGPHCFRGRAPDQAFRPQSHLCQLHHRHYGCSPQCAHPRGCAGKLHTFAKRKLKPIIYYILLINYILCPKKSFSQLL